LSAGSSAAIAPISIRTVGLGKRYALRHHQEADSIRIEIERRVGRLLRRHAPPARRCVWALQHVTIDIHQGEVVGIVGANGAGKSTLARVLSGITAPTTGYADVAGRVGSLLDIGLGFHPDLTGRENLRLGSAMFGMSPAEFRRNFDAMVAFAGLEPYVDAPVKAFSTGMNLRLAFALAAHNDCDILVVDEVLSVGDAGFQRRCLSRLRELAADGRTILLISHQLDLLRELCGRVLRLARGTVAALGPTAGILDAYLADRDGGAVTGGHVDP
jgi:lipopolysaccharide transport system ATP-binding protein